MRILKKGEYYGQKKKELKVNEVILSEYSYVSPSTDWHYHENPYFMYLVQGQIYDVNKKISSTCSPGSLLFHNWQEKHYNYKHSQFAKGFHIELQNKSLRNFLIPTLSVEGSITVNNPNAHLTLAKIYHEFQYIDSFSSIGIESLLISLCRNIEKDIKMLNPSSTWLKTLTDLIHENQEPATLNDLSSILQVHPVHISRTFSKEMGCTLSQYIRRIKIRKSIPYLLDSKFNLTAIAYLCGFADQSHFSRTFKRCMHISPRTYRSRFKV